MGAIASLSDAVNRLTGGSSGAPEQVFWWRDPRVAGAAAATPIAGQMISLWQYEGIPSAGAVPTTVAIPDNTTTGGLKQTDPAGGLQKWIVGACGACGSAGVYILYDRLLHIGGLDGTVATAQDVGGTITRYTDGVGNMIAYEVYTQIGATSRTITASYTNQDGESGQTTPSRVFGASSNREAQRLGLFSLAAGDTGVQAVASVTINATTGTPGNFGINIIHPLLYIPVAVNIMGERNNLAGFPALVEVETGACLALAFMPNSANAVSGFGQLSMLSA